MSSQPETAADKPSDTPTTTSSTEKPTTETTQTPAPQAPQTTKPIKKVKSKKDLKDDPSRFEAPGINFNAKLIGIDDVGSARGDKMCQDAMTRLKMAIKQSGQHKQRLIINVSLEGIRIIDLKTQATNHTHPVHRISFISRDVTDARAFGYVFGAGEGKHKFYAIKTEKAAEALVLSLRDLFQAVYEMKKREVEEAKNKIEEPNEKAEEVKESQEPVYQVPSSKPVENGEEATYQVPTNNNPVQEETTPDLLNLENELHSMEQRIEQIDTMEELFKELEAPPPASSQTSDSTTTSWANSLAGLAPPQPQSQPLFSMGGSPFPTTSQAFPPSSQAFPPAGQNQLFGAPAQQPMFGAPSQQPGFGFQQQGPPPAGSPFGGPFQAPSVPPRTSMGFQPSQPGVFPGTPFPGTQQQQPMFPPAGLVGAQQPSVVVTPANDPFGSEPFGGGNVAFEEGVLAPLKLENQAEEESPAKPQQSDVFGDLVSLGGSSKQKSPKQMFIEEKPKKSLNEMKGERTPSPKPVSPSGFQASGTSGELEIGYSSPSNAPPASSSEPFGSSNLFGSEDPFATDPFPTTTSTAQSTDAWAPASSSTSQVQHNPSQDAQFGGSPFGDDDFNLPVPSGPPPPLPSNVCEQTVTVEQQLGPAIPPRPTITPPMNTRPTPPLPPRPKSNSSESIASSVSSTNSYSESQITQKQETPPPPPPRPKANISTAPVPRPRPRPRTSIPSPEKNPHVRDRTVKVNNNCIVNSVVSDAQKNVTAHSVSVENDRTKLDFSSGSDSQAKVNNSATKNAHTDVHVLESHNNNKWTTGSSVNQKTQRNSSDVRSVSSRSSISDPFVDTDPFVSEDPFKNDPFANDPFAPDPFSDPIFTTPQSASANDPFTSVLPSPKSVTEDTDPFSVFDKTFSSDMFKFDRSSSKKSKLKVTGQ